VATQVAVWVVAIEAGIATTEIFVTVGGAAVIAIIADPEMFVKPT
jgi:hypothetical protein